ncbi:MAG: hypothetical protein KKA84_03885 [Bacteroidetes bacterium]|nr:hypothetical protein [Bacteroidota bacterium]
MKILFIILAAIVLLIVSLLIAQYFGNKSFTGKVNNEIKTVFDSVNLTNPEIVTEESIQHLPSPVQKYLKYAGVVGKERIRCTRLKQRANIKMSPESSGFNHTAVQYFTSEKPAFVWLADMSLFPGFSMMVRDKCIEGKGEMLGKLFSLFPVVFAEGPKINQGALARYVGEMVWQPSAFLEEYCKWEEIDSSSARVKVSVSGVEVNGVFTFGDEGKIETFVCPRWKGTDGEEMSTYVNYFLEYKNFSGYKVPSRGQAVWREKDGSEFIYWDGCVTEVEYNIPEIWQ